MKKYKSGTRWCVWRWTDVVLGGELYLRRLQTPWFSVMLHWILRPDPQPDMHGVVLVHHAARCLHGEADQRHVRLAALERTLGQGHHRAPDRSHCAQHTDPRLRRSRRAQVGVSHSEGVGPLERVRIQLGPPCPGSFQAPLADGASFWGATPFAAFP